MDEDEYRRNPECRKRLRSEWIEVARSYLDGKISMFEAAGRLQVIRIYEPEWWNFLQPFIALWSESDGLPIDPNVRALWNPEDLKREDVKIDYLARSFSPNIMETTLRLVRILLTADEPGWKPPI